MSLRLFALLLPVVMSAGAAPQSALKAGAARIDITPGKGDALLMSGYAGRKEGHKGIHDNLYVRAIVLDNGTDKGAIITADLIGFSHEFWEANSERIARESGIPRQNILIAGTHTHAAPAVRTYPGETRTGPQEAYIRRVEDSLLAAVRQGQQVLEPARVGAGAGHANLNMNRIARFADGTWYLGFNPDGPSDKTVAVVKIETLTGDPIALFVNYAVHGTGMGQPNLLISADVGGATSRFVEKHFEDKAVAVWTSGAAGDQCPIYDRAPNSFTGVENTGMLLGEEVLRVAKGISTSGRVSIRGLQKVVTCAGHRLTPGPRVREKYEWVDAEPVPIRLSLLKVNEIAITGVSGEVLTMIGQRLKRESKLRSTIMVTHCNGSSGYLPDEDAYRRVGYEIRTARVKPGCAESAIANGLLQMIRDAR